MKLKKVKNGTETTYDIEASLDKLSGIEANAEVNQYAFSNVAVKTTTGTTTIEADAKKDILTIEAGNNITLTPDAVSDKITIAAKDTVYNDTDIKNRISAVEGKLNGSGSVTFSNLTTTGLTTKGEVEIYGTTPHIDFHHNNSTDDYTSRIIENSAGAIDILAPNGLKLNNKRVDNQSVTLTANTDRITNVSYTAKYNELLGAVFVRIYGTINSALNTGYDYDLFTINSRVPDAAAALSVKCNKNVMAVAKSNGVISIRPLESGINGYDVYITGFWFV